MADGTSYGQAGQIAQITTSLGSGALFLEGFTAAERFDEPFHVHCQVLSESQPDFASLLGSTAYVTVNGDAHAARVFNGVLAEAALTSRVDDAYRYTLVLRPWFWTLSLNSNCRIFQNQSAQDIIKAVFTAAGVSTDLYDLSKLTSRGTIVRNYCVQYNESDFAFVSRLMEEEGIYYFFSHSEDGHVMLLCDDASAHDEIEDAIPLLPRQSVGGGARVWSWSPRVRPVPGKLSLRDAHLKKFGDPMAGTQASQPAGSPAPEVFRYPGGVGHLTDDGATDPSGFLTKWLEAAQAGAQEIEAEGDFTAVACGDMATVTLEDGSSAPVLVTGAVHVLGGQAPFGSDEANAAELTVSFSAIPSDGSSLWAPLRRTPKPVARGPQVATVVGRSGEVIDVDEFGRVRVQFPWDRTDSNNETSSCWIRVSQGWADGSFGMMNIPRIGEEVIVDYLDGDMDRPIITGRVYNATKTVPYTLPDNKTRSTWKSRTVGDVGTSYDNAESPPQSSDTGYNEIRFEDLSGSEEVYVYAQRFFNAYYRLDESRKTGRNTTVRVGYNRTVNVKNNESKTVEEGDETHTISKGDLTTTISKGDETREVSAGKRTTTIEGDEALTVNTGDQSTTVTKGDITVDATAGKITVTAGTSIELKVGGSSVKIDQTGITLKAPMISSEAQTNNTVKANVMVEINGSATTTVKGGIVMIN